MVFFSKKVCCLVAINSTTLTITTTVHTATYAVENIIIDLRIFQPFILYQYITNFLKEYQIKHPLFIFIFDHQRELFETIVDPTLSPQLPVGYSYATHSLHPTRSYIAGIRCELLFHYQLLCAQAQWQLCAVMPLTAACLLLLQPEEYTALSTMSELQTVLHERQFSLTAVVHHMTEVML
jgi:hypothetical protein